MAASKKEQIIKLNTLVFGKKDYYSNDKSLDDRATKYVIALDKDKETIIGYVIYTEDENCLSGERSAVHPDHRGKGIGKSLFTKVKNKANRLGKAYRTYIRHSNYTSITSHIRIGMRMYHHDEKWVYLTT